MDSNNNNTNPASPASPSTPAGDPPVSQPAEQPLAQAPAAQPAVESTPENPLATTPNVQVGKPAEVASVPAEHGQPSVAGNTPPAPHKSKPMFWVIMLLVFSFFCGLLLAIWYFQSQLQKATPTAEVTKAMPETPKSIVIGIDATFQPMEYTASEGAFMGYDIDLGNRIGEKWGTTVSFKNIPWDDLFKALDDKKIDMIMSSVTITDERKQKYDFSDPYLNAGQVILTQKTDSTITSSKDLQGKRIAVQEGTTNETEAAKLTSKDLVIKYPDFVQATKALVDGNADAILSDLPGAKGIITQNPTLKITSDPLTNDYYGIVFRKSDPNVKKINQILSTFRTQGVLTDLKQKWLD